MDKSLALAALSALAHETRLDILRLLVVAGSEGLPAGEIARRLKIGASALSFHLAAMEQAGLLRSRREGRFMRYSADHARLGALMGWLLNDCCAAHPSVCACLREGNGPADHREPPEGPSGASGWGTTKTCPG